MKKILIISLILMLGINLFAAGHPADGNDPLVRTFQIYPNPTSGQITLSLELFDSKEPVDIKIYNLLGQQLEKKTISAFEGLKKFEFDLTVFPKGIYMIEVSDGKNKLTKRVSVI